jgi:hypothetical protein
MKTRQTTIQAFQAHAAPGTDIYPIRLTDPISRIVMPYSVLIPATARLQHMSDVFTRVVIVDGSDVLLSLTGKQIDGMARMRAISAPATFESPDPSITVWGNLIIDFGRYLYDKVLALDAKRFNNPQIQVTHNAATIAAAGVRCDYAILADIMEDLGSTPQGFLMKKEAKSWLAAAGAWEYTELARDYTYRAIWIQALTKLIAMDQHWSRAILSEDNYKRIPFDCLIDDIIADNAAEYGEVLENVSGIGTGAAAPIFAAPAYAGSIKAEDITALSANLGITNDGGQFSFGTTVNTDRFRGVCQGLCPQGLVVFDMGPKDNIEDWYDPKSLGSLRLEVLGTGARTIRLVTEQLRNY